MTSIIKVNNIQNSSGTAAVTIDGSSNITIPQNATVSGNTTVTGNLSVSGTTTGIPYSTMTLGTTQTVSGNDEADFTGIPSGVKRITVMFHLLSVDGGNQLMVQLGTSGGLTTSGYVSRSDWGGGGEQQLSGFGVYGVSGSSTLSGIMTLVHMGSNVWVESHTARYNSSNGVFGGGGVTLSGTCDRLRVRPDETNTFDGGTVNIMYEL